MQQKRSLTEQFIVEDLCGTDGYRSTSNGAFPCSSTSTAVCVRSSYECWLHTYLFGIVHFRGVLAWADYQQVEESRFIGAAHALPSAPPASEVADMDRQDEEDGAMLVRTKTKGIEHQQAMGKLKELKLI